MKVYSDVFANIRELERACPPGIFVEGTVLPDTRVRARGWRVTLFDPKSKRRHNTGKWGAAQFPADGAASWDTHGEFFAALFLRDPGARVACYDGRDDFEARTGGKYFAVAVARRLEQAARD